MLSHRLIISRIVPALAVSFMAWQASVPTPVLGQDNSFSLRLSEKENELVHTGDMAWEKYNMWDLGFERMSERNMPFLELTNNGDTPLTEFHLTIGDTRFHFSDDFLGQFALLGNSTPSFQISSSTLNDAGDELVVQIGNGGLKKDDGPLRFEIDLDVDPTYMADPFNFYPHPDYRTVLFDIVGVSPYGPQDNENANDSSADNAMYWALFNSGEGTTTTDMLKMPDADVPAAYQGFYNENLRPYRLSDAVGLFEFNGGTSVPEPASGLIGVIALAGYLAGTARGKRSHRRA